MDDVSDEAGASLSQSFGMDKADIFFGRTLKLTLGWKIRSHGSENGKKIMGEDPQSLENHGFPQISQLVLHSRNPLESYDSSGLFFCGELYYQVQTIFYKGIMPSEKILDLPVDCNFLTGSVNL